MQVISFSEPFSSLPEENNPAAVLGQVEAGEPHMGELLKGSL